MKIKFKILSNSSLYNSFVGLCFDYKQNKEQFCADAMCYLSYESSTNNIDGGCDEVQSIQTQFHLLTLITIDEHDQSQVKMANVSLTMECLCDSINWNNRTNAQLIKQAVRDYYDLSTIYEKLNVTIEENPSAIEISRTFTTIMTTTTAITASITSISIINTTEQIKKTSTSIQICIIIIILCLILMIVYWIINTSL